MIKNLKYVVAIVMSLWHLGLFYEIDYFLLKSAFYVAKSKLF